MIKFEFSLIAITLSGVNLIGELPFTGCHPCFLMSYSYRKCACPANRSHRAGYPFTSKPASRSHRNWQAVHIDAGHSFTSTRVNGLLVQLVHIENCTLSARENAPSAGERRKKSLDFSRLFRVGGRNRTRTCDPIDVNDVLYQLSHATM